MTRRKAIIIDLVSFILFLGIMSMPFFPSLEPRTRIAIAYCCFIFIVLLRKGELELL